MVGIVCLLLPLAILLVDRTLISRTWRLGRAFVASAGTIYVLLVGDAMIQQWVLDQRLSAFDLNRDGAFSGAEVTPEQKAAMRHATSDSGRVLAPFTGAILAVGYSGLFFGLVSIVRALWRVYAPPPDAKVSGG